MGAGSFAAGVGASGMGSSSLGDWIKDKLNEVYEYCKFWYIVDEFEEAVILRFGKYHRTLKPSRLPKLKIPIAEIGISAHVKPDTMEIESICITTLDGKSIMMGLVVSYRVVDTKKFLLENNDAPSNLKDMARGELSDLIEEKTWEQIKNKPTKNAIKATLSKYSENLGIEILDLKFTNKTEVRPFKFFNEENKSKIPQPAFS